MANEIQISALLSASKNGMQVARNASAILSMAGNNMLQTTQSIATAATAISFGGIAGAPAKVLIINLDATNYVEIDSANTFDKFPQKLLPGPAAGQPGDCILLSPETGTIYGKAHTAAVLIAVIAVEA